MSSLPALVRADAKRITRDPFLIFVIGYPWLVALLLHEALPWLSGSLADRITLSDYYPIAAALVAVLMPYGMGLVLGFQLLEEKDEGALLAVAATPLSLDQYLVYRAGLYGLVSVPLVLVVHELLAVVVVPPLRITVVALVAAPLVPFMALILSGFASNQVEGFAVMKGAGVLLLGPLASFFIPKPWDLLMGLLPTYWPIKAYFAAAEGSEGLFWAAAAMSLFYPSALVAVLYRRFRRRAMAG